MIPIRLTLEAFGPFAKRQEIDFTAFENDRIFLISGPTGSGKTTIFDAITFCLFGTASGAVREADSFKSQFADEDTSCWAEFEFLVHGKRYLVHRRPIQYRLKRNGNRTKDNSTATLTLEDGTILSGPQNVDAKLQEILGINADQFKKIVMLPQGEFRKFLSDDVNEKQKTLRKIFSTELLDAFTERLQQNAAEAGREVGALLAKCDAVADTIVSDGNAPLEEALRQSPRLYGPLLELLESDIAAQTGLAEEQKQELDRLQEELSSLHLDRARELNEKFHYREENRAALNRLLAKKTYFASLEQQLNAYRAIREIAAYADTAAQASEEIAALRNARQGEQLRLSQTEAEEQTAQENCTNAQKAHARVPELLRRSEQWKQSLQTAARLSAAQEQLTQTERRQRELASAVEQTTFLRQYVERRERLSALASESKALTEAQDAIRRCGELNREFLAVSASYKEAMNAFLESQAVLLAGELAEGRPCPVCGSVEHPAPARGSGRTVTRQQLEREKEQYEEAARKTKEQQGSCGPLLRAAGFTCKEHERLSEYLPDLEAGLSARAEQEAELQREMAQLAARLNPGFDRNCSAAHVEERHNQCTALLAASREKHTSLTETIEALSAQLHSQTGGDPAVRSETEIQSKLQAIQTEIATLEAALEQARNGWERCLREIERSREAIRQLTEQLARRESALQSAQREYHSLLERSGLSEEEFQLRRRESAAAESIERELNDWRETTARLQGTLDSLETELEGKAPADLELLQNQQAALSEALTHAREGYDASLLRCRINRDARDKLTELWQGAGEREAVWRERERLYEVASGKWSDKLSFERYVLASYFGDVIENANQRLAQMTHSRYTLKRRTEREKGNRSSGLSLEVFDAYTGRARHINTLSGGESFKIALALALGLADIISQNSGGIELNTMFIDEGFGSLDQTSLEAAIECLNGLKSSGRYIGIISHVSELKEKIPAKLTVVQEPQGSHIELQTN